MAHRIIDISCPGCGSKVSTGQSECDWCHNPITISTFNSVNTMPFPQLNQYAKSYAQSLVENPTNPDLNRSIAMCYLKLGMRDKALAAFEKAVEDDFNNSETYFYAAVCLLDGKKPFLHVRGTIDKIIEYMKAAISIEPRGIYYYFVAYIKKDYFERKFLNNPPYSAEVVQMAHTMGVSPYDIEQLFLILGTPNPLL